MPGASNSDPTRGKETILLVEDAEMVRALVREVLEQHGYQVLEARDAREAMGIAEQHRGVIDLLLTDLLMPRMGGHELAKRLRRHRKGLKVTYMSGYSGAGMEAAEKGSGFVEKPFKPDALVACVRRVLDGSRAVGEDES